MTMTVDEVGVLGLCRGARRGAPHLNAAIFAGQRESVLGVVGLASRARTRAFFLGVSNEQKSSHANPEKVTTPNTLTTALENPLNSLSFFCVGFVVGWAFLCWVAIGGRWA